MRRPIEVSRGPTDETFQLEDTDQRVDSFIVCGVESCGRRVVHKVREELVVQFVDVEPSRSHGGKPRPRLQPRDGRTTEAALDFHDALLCERGDGFFDKRRGQVEVRDQFEQVLRPVSTGAIRQDEVNCRTKDRIVHGVRHELRRAT